MAGQRTRTHPAPPLARCTVGRLRPSASPRARGKVADSWWLADVDAAPVCLHPRILTGVVVPLPPAASASHGFVTLSSMEFPYFRKACTVSGHISLFGTYGYGLWRMAYGGGGSIGSTSNLPGQNKACSPRKLVFSFARSSNRCSPASWGYAPW